MFVQGSFTAVMCGQLYNITENIFFFLKTHVIKIYSFKT